MQFSHNIFVSQVMLNQAYWEASDSNPGCVKTGSSIASLHTLKQILGCFQNWSVGCQDNLTAFGIMPYVYNELNTVKEALI